MNLFTYGDSWTFGDGISKHSVRHCKCGKVSGGAHIKKYNWPGRLGELLNVQEVFNRSWGGISNYRLVDYFIEDSRMIKKEDIVVFGLTDPQRLTFWCDGKDSKVWLKDSPRGYSGDRVTNADKENILFKIGLFDERWMIYNLWLHIVVIQEICKKIGCKYFIFAPFFKHFRNHHDSTDYFDFSKPPKSFSKIIDYKHIAKKSATEEVLMKDGRRIKYLFAVREAGHPWPAQKHPNEDGYFEIAKWVYKKLGELDVSE